MSPVASAHSLRTQPAASNQMRAKQPMLHACTLLQHPGPQHVSAGANYYVRILSTLNRELLKPSSSVALHRHSNALVDILPPEADSSIAMLGDGEKPDVSYADIGGNDIQKQEIREAVELPLSNPGLYAQVRGSDWHVA